MSGISLTVFPKVEHTTCIVHEPSTLPDGTPRRLTAFLCGDNTTLLFHTPGEAYSWLEHCIEQLTRNT